ncbi:MAG: 23S rRNA (guanosine(2251)-2'-O)-methyltransferase RlmB [Bacteroidetes bacterium]|nr:MAG: 23S rRNA (guanosine(2251)-2'-O)-methyltransferase RlmB [Bacteroidota bacterium]
MEAKEWIFGRHPVIEAIEAGQSIDKVWLQQGTRGPLEKDLRRLCRANDIPLVFSPKEKLNRMVKGNHQGVVALVAAGTYQQLEDILPHLYEQGQTPLFLILDGVTDTRNFGAIARSAELCGVHAIIIPAKGSASLSSDALKTSAGALARIPVCRVNSLVTTIKYLQEAGLRVLASDLSGETYLHELDLQGPLALVLGSEGEGISKGVARAATQCFRIPQLGTLNSFNVSVAAGIMLYETMRQRAL